MAISYKPLYEEAQQQIATLTEELEQLRLILATSADENLRELQRTKTVVDLAGIARYMRVDRFTPQQWKQRDHLPPVDFPHIREPLWYATTIVEKFVTPTRRTWFDNEPTLEGWTTTPEGKSVWGKLYPYADKV